MKLVLKIFEEQKAGYFKNFFTSAFSNPFQRLLINPKKLLKKFKREEIVFETEITKVLLFRFKK